ncbi:MAG TPA: DUF2784 domain-containing protein [Planctomycetes bacterium]|nr:DUF2784 domain-containing protein [Planctomycetota bacterium]
MEYRLLAEGVLAAHFVFILWVIFGGFAVLRKRALAFLHVPALAWGAYIELTGGTCPLTPLENYFREKAGGTGYSEGFIAHYILPVIYPDGLTHDVQVGLGTALIVFNALLYLWVVLRMASPAKKKEPV